MFTILFDIKYYQITLKTKFNQENQKLDRKVIRL